jgi:hypothetical protein
MGIFAYQGLFDFLDVVVPDDDLQVVEIGQSRAGTTCIACRIPRRRTPIANPPFSRKYPPITASPATLRLTPIATKRGA